MYHLHQQFTADIFTALHCKDVANSKQTFALLRDIFDILGLQCDDHKRLVFLWSAT